MRCVIHLLVNEPTTVVAHLSLIIKPNPVVIHYLNHDEALIASDNLSAYHLFNLEQSNHRQCIFCSQLADLACSTFLPFITKAGIFIPVPNNPFSISIPQETQTSLFGYVNRFYRQLTGTTPVPGIQRQVDGIVMGTIDPSLHSTSLVPLSPDDVDKFHSLLFSTIVIPRSVFPALFSRLLAVQTPSSESYLRVRRQWELTSHAEWDHNQAFRIFVHDTEEWLRHCSQAAIV
jgi:hypothetical protein